MVVEIDRSNESKEVIVKKEIAPDRMAYEAKAKDVLDVPDLIARLKDQIDEIESSREVWKEREVRFYKRRQGLRPPKSLPWRNCSNMSMMIDDKVIKKMNPAYFNLIWSPKLIANFVIDPETKGNRDQLLKIADANAYVFDHIVRRRMKDCKRKTMNLIDQKHQHGRSIVKVTYDFRTEDKEYELDLMTLSDEQKSMILNAPMMAEQGGEQLATAFFMTILQDRGIFINPNVKKEAEQLAEAVNEFKKGAMKFTFVITSIVSDCPHWQVVKPQDLIVHGTFNDIQDATMVCHKMRFTPNKLRKAGEEGKLNRNVVREILENKIGQSDSGGENNTDSNQTAEMQYAIDTATGSTHSASSNDMIQIWEVCFYAKVGKVFKKAILTFCPEYTEEPLKFVLLPYEDGLFPYIDFPNEESDDGWLAPRSIPHILDYFSIGIDNKFNQRNDGITLTVAPMLKYIIGEVDVSKVEYRPAQGIPCKTNLNAVEPLIVNVPNLDNLMDEQRQLMYMVEDYIAIPDFTLTDPNAGGAQARRATEVLLKSQDRKSIFRVDLELFSERIQKLFQMTWSRFMQYGQSSMALMVDMGDETKEVQWTRALGRQVTTINPTGTFETTNTMEKKDLANQMVALSQHPIYGSMIKSHDVLGDLLASMDPASVDKYRYSRKTWQAQMKQQQDGQAKLAEMEKKFELDKINLENQYKLQIEKMKLDNEIVIAKMNQKANMAQLLADKTLTSADASRDRNLKGQEMSSKERLEKEKLKKANKEKKPNGK